MFLGRSSRPDGHTRGTPLNPSLDQALDALRSPDELRPEALRGLSDLDAAGAVQTRTVWEGLPPLRRRQAMRLLGDQARQHIELNYDKVALLALQDPDPAVRQQAVANLWECEDPGLMAKFIERLRTDTDVGVRAQTAGGLGRFVYRCEVEDVEAGRKRLLEDALLMAAAAAEEEVRLRSIESLGYSSRPEVPGLIQTAYDSAGEASKRSAITAMGRSGDERWGETVIAEMRNPAPKIRMEAAQAAGELELRQSVTELLELLEDVSPDVQQNAIWALGQIGGKSAERGLRRLLRTAPEESIAAKAEESLEYLAFVESTRQLEDGLRAQDEGG
jgi:HEAT repeat protein